MNGLIGKKVGMTQIFSESGDEIPVTVIEIGPCPVTQIKTKEKDGYRAAQVAFDPITKKDKKKVAKPKHGHFDKAKVKPHRYLKEFRLEEGDETKVGDTLKVDMFTDVDFVSVRGESKGRGFQGVVKRYGQKGASATRGSHEAFRHPGSIGMCEYPARVLKGTRLPGQMGSVNIKVLNLEVVKIFEDKNLLLVRGATPGANGGLLVVSKSYRRKKTSGQNNQKKAKKSGK